MNPPPRRAAAALLLAALFGSTAARALPAATPGFDYDGAGRQLIRNGVQAVLTCNGLFTSHRPLDAVFRQELAYLDTRVLGDPSGGPYTVHAEARAVSVGGDEYGPRVTAAFRDGIGCIVMAPQASLEDIATLPELTLPAPAADANAIAWPNGDAQAVVPVPAHLDATQLQAASDWAFNRPTSEQDTISLVIVYRGKIIHERYAPGFDRHTRTRTWSTAKSIAATLIGMQVDTGKMALDAPLGFPWLPELPEAISDPRREITLRHVLQMSSGLYPVDSFNQEYATGSGLSYWAGASSVDGARRRGLVREPGSYWDYENYDTLLAVYALKQTFSSSQEYLEFPRRRLLDRIGMRSTLLSTDRFGDFILSSQVYSNARDLARFGLLYLQRGVWEGERLLSEDWIDFVRSPAPSTQARGSFYGAQWWLVPEERRQQVPADAFSTAGNRGQYVVVAPSHELVIVRRGLDYGKQGFSNWDLLAEVLKAFPQP